VVLKNNTGGVLKNTVKGRDRRGVCEGRARRAAEGTLLGTAAADPAAARTAAHCVPLSLQASGLLRKHARVLPARVTCGHGVETNSGRC
jgi:hypothetical protein